MKTHPAGLLAGYDDILQTMVKPWQSYKPLLNMHGYKTQLSEEDIFKLLYVQLTDWWLNTKNP